MIGGQQVIHDLEFLQLEGVFGCGADEIDLSPPGIFAMGCGNIRACIIVDIPAGLNVAFFKSIGFLPYDRSLRLPNR